MYDQNKNKNACRNATLALILMVSASVGLAATNEVETKAGKTLPTVTEFEECLNTAMFPVVEVNIAEPIIVTELTVRHVDVDEHGQPMEFIDFLQPLVLSATTEASFADNDAAEGEIDSSPASSLNDEADQPMQHVHFIEPIVIRAFNNAEDHQVSTLALNR